jgi:hypothetical protein
MDCEKRANCCENEIFHSALLEMLPGLKIALKE